jgi:hypothetical protein
MRCSTVNISLSGISQLDGEAVVTAVPREEIRRITLAHDSRVRHPFLQFFAGFILIATGLVFLIAAFLIAEGGVYLVQLKSRTLGIPLLPIGLWSMVGIGLWLITGVFRGRYNLLIDTRDGCRKIFFAESADIREIRDFVGRAVRELGYDVDMSIMQSMHVHAGPG